MQMVYIMKREIHAGGAPAYFVKFGTPNNKKIKGHREWTLDIAYAQQFDESAWTPEEIMKHALAAGMKVSVEKI
jgi:hypothetical protein